VARRRQTRGGRCGGLLTHGSYTTRRSTTQEVVATNGASRALLAVEKGTLFFV
jgi:hypothetical protein